MEVSKHKIFKNNALGILLYSAESWKVTTSITNKLDVNMNWMLKMYSLDILAKHHTQAGAILSNQHHCNIYSDQMQAMAMDWTCPENGPRCHSYG